jgi:NADH-quinone oxidoreductase subunit C
MDLEKLVENIKTKFPEAVLAEDTFRGEGTLTINTGDILPVCRYLRDELSFDYLVDLCGIDFYPREPRFEVAYLLGSMKTKDRLRLKVSVPDENPRLSSVISVWKGADWMEREAYDMYGILFKGHPDLRRILLTPDWEGFPLRKDYPLRGNDSGQQG